jgi:hypothetical protein
MSMITQPGPSHRLCCPIRLASSLSSISAKTFRANLHIYEPAGNDVTAHDAEGTFPTIMRYRFKTALSAKSLQIDDSQLCVQKPVFQQHFVPSDNRRGF